MVPSDLWTKLLHDARETMEILVYAGQFLFDNDPDLAHTLALTRHEAAVSSGSSLVTLTQSWLLSAVPKRASAMTSRLVSDSPFGA